MISNSKVNRVIWIEPLIQLIDQHHTAEKGKKE